MRKSITFEYNDNVATSLTDLKRNDRLAINREGVEIEVTIREQIPFGHKFAVRDIEQSEPVIKYGIPIGRATINIRIGEHVHIHNVESLQTPAYREQGKNH